MIQGPPRARDGSDPEISEFRGQEESPADTATISTQMPQTQSVFRQETVNAKSEPHCGRRARLQAAVNRQTHMRRTPVLSFHADEVARGATRIEEILRDLDVAEEPAPPDVDADGDGVA